jgi:3-dehydroquinate synthase
LKTTNSEMTETISCGNHDVIIGKNALSSLKSYIVSKKFSDNEIFIIADSNTSKYCLTYLYEVTGVSDKNVIIIMPGEHTKTFQTANTVIKKLADADARRNALLICLGGGMVTDLGAFVASVYKRGIAFVHVPTSLLGMVDAGLGSKNGVDVEGIKNLAGLFNPPQAVYTHPGFLDTLPGEEWINGLAEIIKHSIVGSVKMWYQIKDARFGATLSVDDKKLLKALIADAIRIKCEFVMADPYDRGERMALNFGHTVGHALETVSLNSDVVLPHGRAVAAGMICELYMSFKMAGLTRETRDITTSVIRDVFGITDIVKNNKDAILNNLKHDKKHHKDGLVVTLISDIGIPVTNTIVDFSLVEDSLNYYSGLQ